jgi:glycosyltransferase involved in cell wall biosynthesis
MKIAFIVLKGMPFGGGLEKYTEELGSRLAAKGHEIIVYAMRHYGVSDRVYRGMIIKTVPTLQTKSLEKLSASFVAAAFQFGEKNLDVVHFHAFGPAIFSFIPRVTGRKVVVQGHGLEWKRAKWGPVGRLFLKLSEYPSVRCADRVTVVSKVQQDYLKRKYGIESVCIPTGVNPPRHEQPDLIRKFGLSGGDYTLFVGRLVPEKGAHYLIQGFRSLKTDMKLVIAGDAPHEERYKSRLFDLAGSDGRIVFTGHVEGRLLRELFSNCCLFVLPSQVEGLATALLEAMSYGNCCLVSDIPENLEALNGHGYSFRNGDTDDLAFMLERVIEQPSEAGALKKEARDHVLKNYSWDAIATRFEDFYADLLKC